MRSNQLSYPATRVGSIAAPARRAGVPGLCVGLRAPAVANPAHLRTATTVPGVISPGRRLAALVAGLTVAYFAVLTLAPVSEGGLRDLLDPLGVAAPLAYVPISAALGAMFVPGAILAATSGALFGTGWGFVVAVGATVLSAVTAVALARRAGRPAVTELADPRVQRVEALLERHGLWAVVVQRLLPGVPDAPCSYLFGLAGVPLRTVALGTLIGAAPRALSYSAIGDGLGEGGTTLALVGLGGLILTGVVGAGLGARLWRTR